jgi:lipopolysaccharide biosynthesis glycosyltransferase
MTIAADSPAIACAARRDYLPHTETMLSSLFANSGFAGARVHLLVGRDVRRSELEELARFAGAHGHEFEAHVVGDTRLAGLPTTGPLPTVHWYRVLLPDLLPDEQRVLYLDSDLLVLDSLEELWETPAGDHALAAVTNCFPDAEAGRRYCAGLGLESSAYFNSGVMLLNLETLRESQSVERIVRFARAHPELILPEQDAANAVLGEMRKPLSPRWNLMTGLLSGEDLADAYPGFDLEAARLRPAIRHFEGALNKPWNERAPQHERDLWQSYCRDGRSVAGRPS